MTVIERVVWFLVSGAECATAFFFFLMIFPESKEKCRKYKWLMLVLGILLVSGTACFIEPVYSSWQSLAAKILLSWVILCIGYRSDREYLLLFLYSYHLFIQLMDLIPAFLLQDQPEVFVYKIALVGLNRVLVIGCCLLVYRCNKNNTLKIWQFWKALFVFAVAGTLGLLWFARQSQQEGAVPAKAYAVLLGATLSLAAVGLSMFVAYVKMKEQQDFIKMKTDMFQKNYQDMYGVYQKCMYTYHDLKNHVKILEYYMRKKEYEKANAYITKISEPINMLSRQIWCGNEIVNLILNYKMEQAMEKGIEFRAEIEEVGEVKIKDTDLCAILSNLLDNAIDACGKIEGEEKWIEIQISNQAKMFFIKIENTWNIEKRNEKPDPKKPIHGYGKKSARVSVEKYGGTIEWIETEQTVEVQVCFYDV